MFFKSVAGRIYKWTNADGRNGCGAFVDDGEDVKLYAENLIVLEVSQRRKRNKSSGDRPTSCQTDMVRITYRRNGSERISFIFVAPSRLYYHSWYCILEPPFYCIRWGRNSWGLAVYI